MKMEFSQVIVVNLWIGICFAGMFVGCGSPASDAYSGQEQDFEKVIYVVPDKELSKTGAKSGISLQEALDQAVPGTKILLEEGTYEGPFWVEASGNEEAGKISICGEAGKRVTLTMPQGKSGAALDLNGNSYLSLENLRFADLCGENVYGVILNKSEHDIWIRDCEFTNIATTDPGNESAGGGEANAILLLGEEKDSIHDITIEGNLVHDNRNGWSENISVAGNCESIHIEKNQVYHNTNIGIDFYGNAGYCKDASKDQPRHCTCSENVVYDCKSEFAENAGIYVDGAYDIRIEQNTVYDNPYGIEVGSEEWRDSFTEQNQVRDVLIVENRIYGNQICGLRLGGWTNDDTTGVVTRCEIRNNDFREKDAQKAGNIPDIILSKCDHIQFLGNLFPREADCQERIWYDDGIDREKISNIYY